ncbi:peptide chain release factor 2 [bacterium BMS3Abin09]|nr:peptide chain release factor 2 [bacterium BMS3Abin09]GBE41778.1 peptide chain release factor 2 [bacterium BMS3Bbin09]HDN94808.1 peptide chain release factor 2 [Nitrospirota bacterium]
MPSGGIFEVASLQERIKALQGKLLAEDLWEDPAKVQELLKEKSNIENILQPFDFAEKKHEDLGVLLELSEEEDGFMLLEDAGKSVADLMQELDDIELKSTLSLKEDKNNAILTVNPGAGGTESQDWAQILMRMYMRWAEQKGFKLKVIDLLPGDEAGIKSVTMTVSGQYAYGYLKGEAGVHRLVRISPYDANKRRHTSFAAVMVYPEITEDIEIEVNEDDLRIDTFRASGAGGQHVNKTDSAIRITHAPTGIVISCQNERSQHRNKEMAMKILKARLYDLKKEEQDEKLDGFIGEKKEISWGSQIRSYTLQPYQLIKDHRSGYETGNVNAVLDGNLDEFTNQYLLMRKEKS